MSDMKEYRLGLAVGTGGTGGAQGVIPDRDARKGWPGNWSAPRSTKDAMLYRINKLAVFLKNINTYKAANDAATLVV